MKKKYKREELFKMDAVEVYKLVLEKKHIKTFPKGFWQQPEAIDNAIKCTKYLIEEKLNLSKEELKKQLSMKLFIENGLSGMLTTCFNNSPYEVISTTHPEKDYKPWEFNQVPIGYWSNINNAISATKWLVEIKLQLNEDELKQQLSQKIFREHGLSGMLNYCFNGSPYEAINISYPERNYKPWEFNNVPTGYWGNINNAISATKWLIETKLQLNEDEVKQQLSKKLFKEHGLDGMLNYCFNNSPYEAINTTYPNKFKKEDFKNSNYYK